MPNKPVASAPVKHTHYCFCVRCGRPIPVSWYRDRLDDTLPPACAAHVQDVKDHLAFIVDCAKKQIPTSASQWPEMWFGHAAQEARNGKLYWRVQVAAIEERYFMTPLYGGRDWVEE